MLKQWITSITGAAVIAAVADSVMPEGGGKRVGRLALGLLILLAVLKPLPALDSIIGELGGSEPSAAQRRAELEEENRALIQAVIEEKTAAYISDKARELGLECQVQAVYDCGAGGEAELKKITVRGAFSDPQREALSKFLEQELALLPERQTFERVKDQ